MKILFNKKFSKHNPESFAEGAYRISEFIKNSENVEKNGEEFITLVHTQAYLDSIKVACNTSSILAEVSLSPDSYEAACIAVGLTLLASEQNDFAVVRPPGHHSKRDQAVGFCFFNNIAIATQKLVNDGQRVFILDIDGHHGDGTQSIFYYTNKVLFCSIHQHNAYPWTGDSTETGEKDGVGYTMNFPLSAGSGEEQFLSVLDTILEKAFEFKPDVIGVSAGFDGYEKDRLLGLNYTLNSYLECGHRLTKISKNIFAVLEGGYHYDIKKCVESFIEGVNKGS